MDAATCGYAADVARGNAPLPVIAAGDDEPVEREMRRAAMQAVTHSSPAGLLPAAAIDGKLLHGSRTPTGQVFLVAAITHDRGVVLGQRQVPDKRGENTVIAGLLGPLDVAGMMLTLVRYTRARRPPRRRSDGRRARTYGVRITLTLGDESDDDLGNPLRWLSEDDMLRGRIS